MTNTSHGVAIDRRVIHRAAIPSVLGLLLAVPAVWAGEPAAEANGPLYTLDISAERLEQTFVDTDGRITTITLLPAMEWGDGWQLSLELPWQRAEGEYVVPRTTPRIEKLCQWADQHPRRIQAWLAQGRITQAQLDACNALDEGVVSTDAQGVGDMVLRLNRFIPVNERWAVLPQAGYKSDNGDETDGLGSGTRDAMLELGAYGDFKPFTVYLLAGYERVLSQSSLGELDDFLYSSWELEFKLAEQWAIGAGYHYEETQVDYLDNMQSVSGQLTWRFLQDYSAELQVQEYNENSGYPERETGVRLNASF